MSHRKPRPNRNPFTRKAIQLGMLTAGIAAAATAAPAQATAPSSHTLPKVAVANDGARTHANQVHRTQFRDSFTVHQFGTVLAAGVHNQVNAISSGCSLDAPCRSVALSFQIVTMAGEHTRLNAVNTSNATNKHCDGCQTLAGAYQFVVSTPQPFKLDSGAQGQLADIHRRLDALSRSQDSATDLKAQADQLAAEVSTVLKNAVANADFTPDVTVHRHYDGGWH